MEVNGQYDEPSLNFQFSKTDSRIKNKNIIEVSTRQFSTGSLQASLFKETRDICS